MIVRRPATKACSAYSISHVVLPTNMGPVIATRVPLPRARYRGGLAGIVTFNLAFPFRLIAFVFILVSTAYWINQIKQ